MNRGSHVRRNAAGRRLVPATLVVALATASLSLISIQAVGSSAPEHATVSFGSSVEPGELSGVTTTRGGDAWAVGYSGNSSDSGSNTDTKAIILFWNGSHWKPVPTPSPPNAQLRSVAATSPTNAWAVGSSGVEPQSHALILHRTGKSWRQVPSPVAGSLSGVAATSPTNAWAVGSTNSGGSLILHWNGKAWQQMSSPAGGLSAVAASSLTNAWAVGATSTANAMTLHWNGTEWQQIPSPNPGADQGLSSFLSGVVILTRGTALAVGNGSNCGCGPGTTLIARWNGHAWGQEPAPTVGGGVNLFAVTSLSSSRSWAAGLSGSGDGPTNGVIFQWSGSAWTRAPIPALRGDDGGLFGLAATSRLMPGPSGGRVLEATMPVSPAIRAPPTS